MAGKGKTAKSAKGSTSRGKKGARPKAEEPDCPVDVAPGAPVAEILKLPVTLDGYGYRKQQQDWALTFALDSSRVEHGKPLMDYMGDCFILILVKPKDKDDMDRALRADSLEDIQISPDDF